MGESKWIQVSAEAARRHRLFGAGGLVRLLIAAFAWCAAAAAARLALLVVDLLALGPELALDSAVLTFMPVLDLAFLGLFAGLCFGAFKSGAQDFPEAATVVCGLHVLVLATYAYIFHLWTHGAAFSLAAPATYLHVVIPVVLSLWAGLYVNLARRVKVTYLARLHRRDPQLAELRAAPPQAPATAPATTAVAETSP